MTLPNQLLTEKWAVEITCLEDAEKVGILFGMDEKFRYLHSVGRGHFDDERIAIKMEENEFNGMQGYVGRVDMFKNNGYTICTISELEKLINP